VSVSAATRLFALLGDPVRHSLSPPMHNAAMRTAGIDAVYVALRCGGNALPGLLRGLALAGGGGNITVPHKATAVAALDEGSAAVLATGACNTFWLDGHRIRGDNTDVAGFARAALSIVPALSGIRVLLLGAGGGAAAAVRALLDHGAAHIAILARSPDRAARLASRQDPEGAVVAIAPSEASLHDTSFDLVVNATPLGLRPGDAPPIGLDRLRSAGAVLDMTYRPGGTAWVRQAKALGVPACDGTRMLVEQGAAAFRVWFGVEPPIAAMRAALPSA
jgi:shikimate dehydrogenase